MSSAPLLIDTTVDGRPRKLVAVPSKVSWLYVFDRITGQPIWPIEERPVPQSDVPGEKTSPTQPHPTKPPAYARQFLKAPDDVIDFTPEMRAQALETLKRYKNGPLFNPPILGNVNGRARRDQHRQRRRRHELAGRLVRRRDRHRLRPGDQLRASARCRCGSRRQGFSDMTYVSGREGTQFVEALGPGFGTAADSPLADAVQPTPPPTPPPPRVRQVPPLSVEGLPLVKPPYGVLSAINLEQGRADVPGAARRYAGQRAQPSEAAGHEHPEDRPGRAASG